MVAPPSLLIIIRSGISGSAHMSWVSPPPGAYRGHSPVVGDAVAVGGEVDLVLVGRVHRDAGGRCGGEVSSPMWARICVMGSGFIASRDPRTSPAEAGSAGDRGEPVLEQD